MNKVILIGHVGNDPETKNFDNGNQVTNFSLATSESYKDKQGQKVENTEWHKIQCFNKLAEVAEKYFKKGSKILVEGKLKTRSWENKEGSKVYVTEIIINSFEFLDSKKTESHSNQEQPSSEEGDLPF